MRGKRKGENDRAQSHGHPGREWWGRRPFSGTPTELQPKAKKRMKQLLHKLERLIWKRNLKD